jgi:hypothetical protein
VEWRHGVLNQIMPLKALPIQPELIDEISSVQLSFLEGNSVSRTDNHGFLLKLPFH